MPAPFAGRWQMGAGLFLSRDQRLGQAATRRDRQCRPRNLIDVRASAAAAMMSATIAVSPRNTNSQVTGLPFSSQPHDRTFAPGIIPHMCFEASSALSLCFAEPAAPGLRAAFLGRVVAAIGSGHTGPARCLAVARYSRPKTFGTPSPIS